MADALEWEAELPQRGAGSLAGPRPRARLRISSETHGVEAFSVPVAVGRALRARRRSGELAPGSRNELLHLLREVELECGRARVGDLVDRRDYSRKELLDRLGQDGYPSSVAEPLVERAVSCGMVDDARFADSFIRSKLACGWGRLKIERELGRRGIEAASLAGWPDEYLEEGSESERAYELAARRRLTGKNDLQKLVRFLVSRGFSSSVAFDAARRVLDAQDEG